MIFDGYQLIPGADGLVPRASPAGDTCCPDSLCVDFCGLACAFIGILPTGPMWDRPKAEAMAYYNGSGTKPCEPACPPPFPCPTLVQHAIYVARKLHWAITQILWPSMREEDPNTAIDTLDDWLDRFGWEDCFRSHCRSVLLGDITPYEIDTPCGPLYCPIEFPAELDCAVKRGIVIALQRAQMVGVYNIGTINFIIEPLGSRLVPSPSVAADDCTFDPNCCQPTFDIINFANTLPGCPDGNPECGPATPDPEPVQAYFDRGCDVPAGLPQVIWPGMVAAECIVRSLLPQPCPSNIIANNCGRIIELLVAVDADGERHPFAVDTPTTTILSAAT